MRSSGAVGAVDGVQRRQSGSVRLASALSPSSPITASAPAQAAPAGPLSAAGQQSGDLLVWLSSTPAQPVAGDAQLDTFITDRRRGADQWPKVTYDADMTNMSHGPYLVATEPAGSGHYAGDVHFSMPGPWRVITIIERPGLQTVRLRFEFRVKPTRRASHEPGHSDCSVGASSRPSASAWESIFCATETASRR